MIKIINLIAFFSLALFAAAQTKLEELDQKLLIQGYEGIWYSCESTTKPILASTPQLKMINRFSLDSTILIVEVYQWNVDHYEQILTELITYDEIDNKIKAFGKHRESGVFIGVGEFMNPKSWIMEDRDLIGNKIMDVEFDFINAKDVIVKGLSAEDKVLWQTRYLKKNSL